ncbi:MAG: hypothetical protein JW750_09820 [Anaerolineaceae bacterium]|nr:hypothetical protein [Anaerolineaceae bacterium]
MQEIADSIFYEAGYPGVTLGAVNMPQGLLMIDSPIYADDARSWRSALLNLGNSGNRLLMVLDSQHDRSLGLRNMECRLIGHEDLPAVYKSRPVSIKAQEQNAGAEWEDYGGLGSIRWLIPEITFSDVMYLHWDEVPLRLEYHPGPSIGSSWVVAEKQSVIFVGDAVILDQPLFFADADIPKWIDTLKLLLTEPYQNYTLVSGRSGLVTTQDVAEQIKYLEKADSVIRKYFRRHSNPEDIEDLIDKLGRDYEHRPLYRDRLAYGLQNYCLNHFGSEED